MNRLKTKILFLFLFISSLCFAGEEPVLTSRKQGNAKLRPDSTVVLRDDRYSCLQTSSCFPSFVSTRLSGAVVLGIDQEYAGCYAAFSLSLDLEVTYWDTLLVSHVRPVTLSLDYDPAAGVRSDDREVLRLEWVHRIEAKVVSVSSTLPGNAVPENVYLENILVKERWYNMSVSSSPAFNTVVAGQADELTLSWSTVAGAEEYDLEWTYVDDFGSWNGSSVTYRSASSLPYSLRNNGTRVTVKETQHTIKNLYEHGWLLFRVRAVSRTGPGFTQRREGRWSSHGWAENGMVSSFGTNNKDRYAVSSGHENNLNWQWSTGFAENGKSKTVISYLDGTLRSRQMVTHNSTDDISIVGESFYDHVGRPALSALPAPTGESLMRYYDAFNVSRTRKAPYSWQDYDSTDGVNLCENKVAPMDTTSGASRYYSYANPDKGGFQAYVPDAQMYPFSHTEYTPDMTGRIRRQGGVGKDHQLGSGHETKYYYGAVGSQQELTALFGVEVGNYQHYKKNMVADPNGQVSVSYIHPSGKVIATALAGFAPQNVSALSGDTARRVLTGQLHEKNQAEAGAASWKVTHALTLSSPAEVVLSYTFRDIQGEMDCGEICYTCVYDLRIQLEDECGNLLLDHYAPEIRPFDTTCAAADSFVFTDTRVLPLGQYYVSKQLSVSERHLAEYEAVFLRNQVCLKTVEELYDSLLNTMDYMDCGMTCESCLDDLGSYESYVSARILEAGHDTSEVSGDSLRYLYRLEYDARYSFCNDLCDSADHCGGLLSMILQDVSPGGQYMEYEISEGGEPSVSAGLSLLQDDPLINLFPLTGGGHARSWQAEDVLYLEENGDTSYVMYEGEALRPNELPLEAFLAAWRPAWAYALAPLHPEYCYYEWCMENSVAHDFDYEMTRTGSYAAAEDKQLLNPLKLNDPSAPGTYSLMQEDPFFAVGGKGYALRSLAVNRCEEYASYGSSDYSIWEIAVLATFCPRAETEGEMNACVSSHSFGSGTEGEKNEQWNFFRSFYRGIREVLADSARAMYVNSNQCSNCRIGNNGEELYSTSCSTVFDDPAFAGRQKLFPALNEGLGVNMAAGAEELLEEVNELAREKMEEHCRLQCESYADRWMQQLSGCELLPEDSVTLREGLIEICRLGCDEQHPLGSSSVADEYEYTVIPGNFGTLMQSLDIPNFRSKICAPELIDFPLPYRAEHTGGQYVPMDVCARNTLKQYGEFQCDNNAAISLQYILVNLMRDHFFLSGVNVDLDAVLDPGGLISLEHLKPYFYVNALQDNYYKTRINGEGHLLLVFTGKHGAASDSCVIELRPGTEDMPFNYAQITNLDYFVPFASTCSPDYDIHRATLPVSTGGGFVNLTAYSECFEFCQPTDTFSTTAGRMQWRLKEEQCIDISLEKAQHYARMICGDTLAVEYVPAELSCNKPCIGCLDLSVRETHFASTYGSLFDLNSDTVERDLNYTRIYTGYMNNALGLNKQYEDYRRLKENCGKYASFCDGGCDTDPKEFIYSFTGNELGRMAKGCYNWPGHIDSAYRDTLLNYLVLCADPVYDPGFAPDTLSCDSLKRELAMQQAVYMHEQLKEEALQDFRSQYRSQCSNIAGFETFSLKYEIKEYHYTLYYYDQAGNLVKTIPPRGFRPITHPDTLALAELDRKNGNPATTANTPRHTHGSRYFYNTWEKPREQRIRDAGTKLIYYDALGRPVISQNALQTNLSTSSRRYYSYTLYDELGRIKEVGEALSPQAITHTIARNPALLAAWIANCYEFTQQTRTVYEDPLEDQDLLDLFSGGKQENLRNRVSYIYSYGGATGDNTNGHLTAYSYDVHGNVKELVQDFKPLSAAGHHFGAFHTAYSYDLVSGNVNQVKYQAGKTDGFSHRYEYDADNRIQAVYTSKDNLFWDRDAHYDYYKHGPLARVETGELGVQGTDYAYTLHGWLKGVNSATLDSSRDMGKDGWKNGPRRHMPKDEFGFTLDYYRDDYQAIHSPDNAPKFTLYAGAGSGWDNAAPSLYNGNIRQMTVAIGKFMEGAPTRKPQGYAYKYDQVNRLLEMNVYDSIDMTGNTWYVAAQKLPYYHNRLIYDGNGNILTQVRRAGRTGHLPMDSMIYHYKSNSNQLTYVDDVIPVNRHNVDMDDQTGSNYRYDLIGNLVYDRAEGIDSIKWNLLGKMTHVYKKTGPSLEFQYGPDGHRTVKRLFTGDSTLSTEYYVRDAQGNIMSVYDVSNTMEPKDLDSAYSRVIDRLIDYKDKEQYAEFIAWAFHNEEDWREKTLEYLPPHGMESSFTLTQALNCMGDRAYSYLFGSCDSCDLNKASRAYDSLINRSWHTYQCVTYNSYTQTNHYTRDYASWPSGADGWTSTAPFYNLTHDLLNQRMQLSGTSGSNVQRTTPVPLGKQIRVRFDIASENSYDDIQLEIWDGLSIVYSTNISSGTGMQQIDQTYTSSSGSMKLEFYGLGSGSTQFYLDNILVSSYGTGTDTSCVLKTSRLNGLDTLVHSLWNCNAEKVIRGFLQTKGIKENFLADFDTRMSTAYSASGTLSMTAGYFKTNGYTGPGSDAAFLAHFTDAGDLTSYLVNNYVAAKSAFKDIILSDYLPYLKTALDTVFTPCELISCIGSCELGTGARNLPSSCSNLLSGKIPGIGNYTAALLHNPDKHLSSQLFYCYPEEYEGKTLQNLVAGLTHKEISTAWPEAFATGIQHYPYAQLLDELNSAALLNTVSACQPEKLLGALLATYPREYLNYLSTYRSLAAICSDFSVSASMADNENMGLILQINREALIDYLTTTYLNEHQSAVNDFTAYSGYIPQVIMTALSECELKTCIKNSWGSLGQDSSMIYNYVKTYDWVQLTQKLYTNSETIFNYNFAYLYQDYVIEILQNESYPLATFMDKIENYFDLTTRRQIDTDTLVGHSTITAKEYMIYGSERVGAHHRNELIKDVETEYYIYLSNPENVWSASSTTYSPRVYDSIYTLHRGEKRYAGSNHLGNVLVTYSDKRLQTCTNDTIHFYKADLRSATDYYPFGMTMPGRNWYSGTDSLLRFGFNGMMRDDDVKGLGNSLDFGARIYDPRLGKFLSLDPAFKITFDLSSYSFAGNNPIYFMDYNGMFRMSKKMQREYPEVTQMLKNMYSFMLHEPRIYNAYKETLQLSDKQIESIFKWGRGPKITIKDLEGYGETDYGNGRIYLDKGFIGRLKRPQAEDYYELDVLRIFMTIVHEAGHYGNRMRTIPLQDDAHYNGMGLMHDVGFQVERRFLRVDPMADIHSETLYNRKVVRDYINENLSGLLLSTALGVPQPDHLNQTRQQNMENTQDQIGDWLPLSPDMN
jgi:RHS repeat-associated protein